MFNRKKDEQTAEQQTIGKSVSFYASESYKRLRTGISFCVPQEGKCRVIGITSSLRREGKSTTAINLAYSLAQDGKKVLLIDGDMRIPTIAARLNLNQSPGLSNYLAGNRKESVMQHCADQEDFYVMSAGDVPPNPSELLGSERMRVAIGNLKELLDYIIIDLPPVTEVVDALVVAPLLDGMIVVVRKYFTSRRALSDVMRQLKQSEVRILGFVLTHDESYASQFGKYRRYGKYKLPGAKQKMEDYE